MTHIHVATSTQTENATLSEGDVRRDAQGKQRDVEFREENFKHFKVSSNLY